MVDKAQMVQSLNIMTNKIDKLISLRFASPTDPILAEALTKLQSEKWDERTELLGMWYKCWLESRPLFRDTSLVERCPNCGESFIKTCPLCQRVRKLRVNETH